MKGITDYEQCSECGFDHEYEYEAAFQWHKNNTLTYWLCQHSFSGDEPVAFPFREGDTAQSVAALAGYEHAKLVSESEARSEAPDSHCFSHPEMHSP